MNEALRITAADTVMLSASMVSVVYAAFIK